MSPHQANSIERDEKVDLVQMMGWVFALIGLGLVINHVLAYGIAALVIAAVFFIA